MNHNHKHDHCLHVIKHCALCDLAYCTKCGKEWGGFTTWVTATDSWDNSTITTGGVSTIFDDPHTHSY